MSRSTIATTAVVCVLLLVRLIRPSAVRPHKRRPPLLTRTFAPSANDWATFLDTTATEVRSGSSLIAALDHARQRHPLLATRVFSTTSHVDADMAIVAQSINAALQLGGPVAATLHHGAALLRERAAQRADALAYSAQARLSAKVLTAVPLLFAFWNAGSSASFRDAVMSSAGLTALIIGLVLNALGWSWMHRIIVKAAP